MKKIVLISIMVLLADTLFAQQGIKFYNGTWKDALTKAEKGNKLIFIDVSTSWCGPCKKMAAEVFTQKKVGEVFNGSFVNYHIDAEKGEGIKIAKEFGVQAFPTYLFVNGTGKLIYRSVGYMEADKFLGKASDAIKEKNDPKPFAQWENEYNAGDRKKEFLIGYLKKRAALRMPSAEIIDQVFPLLSSKELNDSAFLSNLIYYDPAVEYVPKGNFYQYVITHSQAIDSFLGKSDNFSLEILQLGIGNYFKKDIIENVREEMLPVMVAANDQLSNLLKQNDGTVTSKGLVMDYYAGTHNATKLIPAAQDYVDNGLLKENINGMIDSDKVSFENWLQPYLNGTQDSTRVQQWDMMKRLSAHNKMIDMSYNLRHAAEVIYQNVDDKDALKEAAGWAKLADSWFPHFSTEAVYAGLLLKIGRKQEAIKMMRQASEDKFLKNSKETQELLLANVKEMESDKAPEKLW